LPALARPGVGLIVSPLIALMEDQVAALRALDVRAAFLNSSLDAEAQRSVVRKARSGELDLLYVAPERLLTDSFLDLMDTLPLALFAIDEAHCVSQWGHDFRPEYLQLGVLHERWPRVPRIALTATADPPTRREIATKLALTDARLFLGGFDRPNIQYRVAPKNNARAQLLRFLRDEHPEDSGIVYCLSRKRVEEVAAALNDAGHTALPYHAGLDAEERRANQRRFVRDEVRIVVATVAFGMGIDKPDVRFVYHLDPPKSLEAYYQETGRAGRDGLPSTAMMTWGVGDVGRLRWFIQTGGSEERARVEHHKLSMLLGFCETARCRRQVLLEYFGEERAEPCGNCDTCLSPVETWDGTVAAQKALSAVKRTGERFGQGYLIDVLLGNSTDRTRKFGHEALPTFGVGVELDKHAWQSVFRQMVAGGLLAVDVDGHGGMKLAGRATDVLRGELTVELRRDPLPPPRGRSRGKGKRGAALAELASDADRALFETLRAKRLELAKAEGLAAYMVFADRTLIEMAQRRPKSARELESVHGVGAAKLERWGEEFLAVIRLGDAASPDAPDG
ncbi:DNA helicase RecQ, partial [bacterium]|nr:DNA helicase RecQ [bacterium]